MATIQQNARIKRGGSYTLRIKCIDDNGDPLNLSDGNLVYEVSERSSRSAVLTVTNISTEQADGTGSVEDLALVPITTENSTFLSRRRWYHELFMIDTQGERAPLMTGSLQVVDSLAAEYEQET